jgi:chromosome segregation ATPase
VPKLLYQDPDLGQEVVVEISPELPEITIGRNPGNIIRINNPSVSRRHTKFVLEMGVCTVYDLDSSNGTYVNGMRVQSQVLKHGDRVRVGEFPLEFLGEAEVAQRERAETDLGMGPHGFGMTDGMNFGFDVEPSNFASGLEQATSAAASGYGEMPMLLGDDDFQELEPEEIISNAIEEDDDDPFAFIQAPVMTADATVDEDLDIAASVAGFGMGAPRHDGLFASEPQAAQPYQPSAPVQAWDNAPAAAVSVDPNAELEEELRELGHRLAQLAEENAELRRALDSQPAADAGSDAQTERLRKERDRLADERRNLMRQLAEVKQQLEEAPSMEVLVDLETELGEARQRADHLEQSLAETERTVSGHEKTIGVLEADRDRLAGELAQLKERFDAAEQVRMAVDEERSQLGDQLSELHGNLQGFESRYHEAQARIEKLEETLEQRHAEITSLQQARDERDVLITELRSTLSQQEADIEVRDERIEALLESLNSVTEERDDARQTITALQIEIERRVPPEAAAAVQERLDRKTEEADALMRERDALTAERDGLISELSQTRQGAGDIEARFQQIAAERDELRRERDTLKQEKAAFARETDYLQVERRKQQDQIAELSKKVDDFEKDKKRKKQIFDELSRDLRGLVEENNKLHGRIEAVEGELQAAPSVEILESLNRQIEQYEAQLEEAKEQIAELDSDTTRMTRDLGQFAEEREELTRQLEAAKEELSTLRAAVEDTSLQDELVEVKAAREQMVAQLTELETARATLEEQLSSAVESRDELSAKLQHSESLVAERDAELERLRGDSGAELEKARAEAELAVAKAAELEAGRESLAARIAELEQELTGSRELGAKMQAVIDEKATLEATLAELILERDRLEDELRKK